MKEHFFTVNDNDGTHVGTLRATDRDSLRQKLVQALEQHFDASCEIPPLDEPDSYLNCDPRDIPVRVDTNQDGEFSTVLTIQETWIY